VTHGQCSVIHTHIVTYVPGQIYILSTGQEIGREGHLQIDLFCVELDAKLRSVSPGLMALLLRWSLVIFCIVDEEDCWNFSVLYVVNSAW